MMIFFFRPGAKKDIMREFGKNVERCQSKQADGRGFYRAEVGDYMTEIRTLHKVERSTAAHLYEEVISSSRRLHPKVNRLRSECINPIV